MEYHNLLKIHALRSLSRSVDIPRHDLGIREHHASVPRQNFGGPGLRQTDFQAVKTYDKLLDSSLGIDISPSAFPHTGYIGEGII